MAIDDNTLYGLTGAQIKEIPEKIKSSCYVLSSSDANYDNKIMLPLLAPGLYKAPASLQTGVWWSSTDQASLVYDMLFLVLPEESTAYSVWDGSQQIDGYVQTKTVIGFSGDIQNSNWGSDQYGNEWVETSTRIVTTVVEQGHSTFGYLSAVVPRRELLTSSVFNNSNQVRVFGQPFLGGSVDGTIKIESNEDTGLAIEGIQNSGDAPSVLPRILSLKSRITEDGIGTLDLPNLQIQTTPRAYGTSLADTQQDNHVSVPVLEINFGYQNDTTEGGTDFYSYELEGARNWIFSSPITLFLERTYYDSSVHGELLGHRLSLNRCILDKTSYYRQNGRQNILNGEVLNYEELSNLVLGHIGGLDSNFFTGLQSNPDTYTFVDALNEVAQRIQNIEQHLGI